MSVVAVTSCLALSSASAAAQTAATRVSASGSSCHTSEPLDALFAGTVYFAFNSSRLTREARCILSRLSATALGESVSRVLIVGHADQAGDPVYNLALSQRRASAVLKFMQARGVHPGTLKIDWKGEYQPTVPDPAEQPEALNRRVEVTLER